MLPKIIITSFLLSVFAATGFSQEITELKIPGSNKIVIKLMFRNGSITDPKGKEGLTMLTSDLITEGGTKEYTREKIMDMIYPWAAQYGSSTDKEVSIFTFEVPKQKLDAFYPILKGVILTPTFLQQDFDRLKSNQQNYVDQVVRTSDDEEYGKKALEEMLFQGTNYEHLSAGSSSGVKAITLDDVKAHYKNFYTINNLQIGIAGDYSDAFLTQLKTDMQQLPQTKPAVPAPGKAIQPDGIHVKIIAKDALGSAISGGFPLPITRANDDFAALMVANSWLGEHRKSYSRLYQKIREARSMNYGDYSYIEWYQSGGRNMLPPPGVPRSSNYFSFWIRPVQTAKGLKEQYPELSDIKIGHAQFAIRMVIKEMDQLIKNGLTQDAFELTRDFLRSYIKLYVQSPEQQLGYLMDSKFYGRTNYINELDALLAKVTLADVNAAIKKYWNTKNMDIVIITDKTEAEPLAASLRADAPSPMSYSNTLKPTLPQVILDEDKIVETYSFPVKSVIVVNTDKPFR